jgi:hypothetical protein
MNIFLSWAGESSKHIASAFFEWLPSVLTYLEPWMSTRMEKGDAWDGKIASALYDTPVALICLTHESLSSHYLHYEAGAISNVKGAKVCTFLYGLNPIDIHHPLARFQHTIFEKEDVYRLLKTINTIAASNGEKTPTEERLRKALEKNWEDLVIDLNAAPKAESIEKKRPEREILEEILAAVRKISTPAMTVAKRNNKPTTILQRHLLALAEDFQRTKGINEEDLLHYLPEFKKFISGIIRVGLFPSTPSETDLLNALHSLKS